MTTTTGGDDIFYTAIEARLRPLGGVAVDRVELEKLSAPELARLFRDCDPWNPLRHQVRTEMEIRYRRWSQVMDVAWFATAACLLVVLLACLVL